MNDVAIINTYFQHLSEKQKTQFAALLTLYEDWNKKINVISRKDIGNLYVNHVLHSLGISKVVSFQAMAEILDFGTGGGFPGIPLAILFPDTSFHLVDSIGKKIIVVKSIIDELKLTNVEAEKNRAEGVKRQYDFAIGRAVTQLSVIKLWIQKSIKQKSIHSIDNGLLYLKGGDVDKELNAMKVPYSVYDLFDFFQEEYFQTKKIIYLPLSR